VLAALAFYRRDVFGILRSLAAPRDPRSRDSFTTALLVLAALVPTFIVVKAFEGFFEGLHTVPASAVAGLAINGAMLIAASRFAPAGTLDLVRTPWVKAV